MKQLFFSLMAALVLNTVAFSQSDRYMGAMTSALRQLDTANDAASMADVAAKFERIGDAEKAQWLPYYYAAQVKARMSMQGLGGDKDKVADEAQVLIDKADAISKNNSEICCVKNMVITAKLLVDPASRYMQYLGAMNSALEDAKRLDPANPRPYVLQALSLKGTPEQYGGGCKVARPVAEKAVAMYASFKPDSPISPNWGKNLVEDVVKTCN